MLRDLDLNRARASEARAAFIVADKKCRDAAREDSLNTMSAAAIRNLCPSLPIFAQILDESARQHMEWVRLAAAAAAEVRKPPPCVTRAAQAIAERGQVVSLSAWKYRMLGRTPMRPGFSTMVANLVESHTRWVPEGFPISHWFECVRDPPWRLPPRAADPGSAGSTRTVWPTRCTPSCSRRRSWG